MRKSMLSTGETNLFQAIKEKCREAKANGE